MKSLRAILVAGALAGAVVTGSTATTTAFDQHFLDCFGWMIVDPDTHSANCLPSRVAPSAPGTTSKTGSGDDYDFEDDYEDDFDGIIIDGDFDE